MAQHPVFHTPSDARAPRAARLQASPHPTRRVGRCVGTIGLVSLLGVGVATDATAADRTAGRLGPESSGLLTAPPPGAIGSPLSLASGPGSLRLDFDTLSARFDLSLPLADDALNGWRRPGWQLLGDYHFGAFGGLRATGGLLGPSGWAPTAGLIGPAPGASRPVLGPHPAESLLRGQLWTRGLDSSVATYVGVGYSLRPRPSGWELSADLGLVGQRDPGEVRLGRSGTPSADWLRELRLRPLLQVGASYAF